MTSYRQHQKYAVDTKNSHSQGCQKLKFRQNAVAHQMAFISASFALASFTKLTVLTQFGIVAHLKFQLEAKE